MSKIRLIFKYVPQSPGLMAGLLISLLIIASIELAQADGPNRVGLVVAHGDGQVITQCIEFSEPEITGLEVLERSGLDFNVELGGGLGSTICRLDGEGCAFPAEACFCQCQGSPCTFWVYWYLSGGQWVFSNLGASSFKVHDGDVQGWRWAESSPGGEGTPPPLIPFATICALPPTETPSPSTAPTQAFTPAEPPPATLPKPTATTTGTPTATFTAIPPTATPTPPVTPPLLTATPSPRLAAASPTAPPVPAGTTPLPPTATSAPPTAAPVSPAATAPFPAHPSVLEPIITFEADSLTLAPGGCTSLRWAVRHASAVYFNEIAVGEEGAQQICLAQGQVYTLRVLYPGGERSEQITLQVTDVSPTPAPSLTPAAAIGQLVKTPVAEAPAALESSTVSPAPSGLTLLAGAALLGCFALFAVAVAGLVTWQLFRRR